MAIALAEAGADVLLVQVPISQLYDGKVKSVERD